MRPTQILRSEDPPVGKYGKYLNKATWGNLGVATPERGIITYALSSDRQNILAGAGLPALRNTWRRFAGRCFFGRRRWWRLGMLWSGLTRGE
ncbi:ubiquinol--cytochrome-c reductase chain [Apiospora arundinis]